MLQSETLIVYVSECSVISMYVPRLQKWAKPQIFEDIS